jgi:23S rRNA pseudouridine2457 synthase
MLILFNKPYGVITQFSEHENYMSLKDFIPYKNVYPAGRLDADSEGLVILTDNGKIQNQIASPESDNKKTYWVQVENIPEESDLKKLREGVLIKDYITKKASVKLIKEPKLWDRDKPIRFRKNIPTSWLEIKISEGKNRQIRKMTATINCPTLRLIRISVGKYYLDNLVPGEFRLIGDQG